MRHLIRLILLRYLRAAPERTLLTLFGVMLGVAAIFAVDIVNKSVLASFRDTIDRIAGKTALTVGDGTGVPESFLERVREVPGIAAAVPVIEDSVRDVQSGTQLVVLGVDALADGDVRDYEMTADDVQIEDDLAFLNDPHGVLVTERFAKRRGLSVDDTLQLETLSGPAEFTVRGTLAPRGPAKVFGGDLLLMDVYAAQIAFGRGQRFDRIDVVPEAGVAPATVEERLKIALAGKADISRPERRSQQAEHLMAGFQLGLSLAGLVAIFVGAFIVYNALAIAVAQRRGQIGILRALGCTRAQILALFIGEGVFLGALGAAVGVGIGYFLAGLVLETVSETVSALYVSVRPEQLEVAPSDVIVAVSLGVAASLVAALWPASRAAYVEPATVIRRKTQTTSQAGARGQRPLQVSAALALVAITLGAIAHIRETHMLGYVVAGVLSCSGAFLAPTIARSVGLALRRAMPHPPPSVLLGIVGFTRNAERNAVAIAALGLALANVVNADAFVNSMKESTSRWYDRVAHADIVVFAGRKVQTQTDHPVPPEVPEQIAALPDIEFVNSFRMRRQRLDGKPFYLASHDLESSQKYNEIPVVEGDLDQAVAAIAAGTAVAANEVFVRAFGLTLGDRVTLHTPNGLREFSIDLIYVDYVADLGILLTTRAVYTDLWRDTLVDSLGIYVRPGADKAALRRTIANRWGNKYGLLALSNGEYKAQMMQFIERSFAFTRTTELIAIIIAILGIINTLLVTVMDRRTEIGVLKAIGAAPGQIRKMLTVEGALIALSAALLGIGLGAALSAYIVKEALRFQIGWHLGWHLPITSVVSTLVIAQLVALVASFWPARSASKVDPIQALQYE